MPLLSLDEFRKRAGFPVDDLVKRVKDELNIGRVRIFFDNPHAQAMSRYVADGALEIHLPDLDTILSQRPELTREEAIAKIKAATIEECCHGRYHQTEHSDEVVSCTINAMKRHLRPEELEYPYIKEKTSRLRGASNAVQGMPIRR